MDWNRTHATKFMQENFVNLLETDHEIIKVVNDKMKDKTWLKRKSKRKFQTSQLSLKTDNVEKLD